MDIKDLSVPRNELGKFVPAFRAAKSIEDGMTVGLGTGTTAYWFVVLLAQRIKSEGLRLKCVSTSVQTAELANFHAIPIHDLNDFASLDIVVDGADEIAHDLNLLKGGGGALLREKIVAHHAERMIIIAEQRKYVTRLGSFPLPIEIVKYGWQTTQSRVAEVLRDLAVGTGQISVRRAGIGPMITDEGHYTLDCQTRLIDDPETLAAELTMIPGVVETGLFVNYADQVLLGTADGQIETISICHGNMGVSPVELPSDLEITE